MIELAHFHQKIIHFPIAFLVIYPFIELLALFKKSELFDRLSLIILVIGIVGLVAALISGNSNLNLYKNLSNNETEILNKHIEYANFSAWFAGLLFLIRLYLARKIKSHFVYRIIIVLISLMVLFFIMKTGEYGGLTNEIITIYKKNY